MITDATPVVGFGLGVLAVAMILFVWDILFGGEDNEAE